MILQNIWELLTNFYYHQCLKKIFAPSRPNQKLTEIDKSTVKKDFFLTILQHFWDILDYFNLKSIFFGTKLSG